MVGSAGSLCPEVNAECVGRLIVRRVKPTPGSQWALFTTYSYHAFITDRDGDTLELEADHRRHAEIENAIRDLKYGVGINHLPSGRFPANAAWLAVQTMAHLPWAELAGPRASAWASRWPPPRPSDGASSPWPDASPQSPPPHPASPPGLALAKPVLLRPDETALPTPPFLTAPSSFDRPTMTTHASPISAQAGLRTASAGELR